MITIPGDNIDVQVAILIYLDSDDIDFAPDRTPYEQRAYFLWTPTIQIPWQGSIRDSILQWAKKELANEET